MDTSPTKHKYTITVIATHMIRETYVVFSDKSIEDLKEDIKNDPFQLYCGDAIDMIDEEFIETELEFDGITTDNEVGTQAEA
jgi:hypothetical protein